MPLCCHCDGRSGALEGARGHSHRFRMVGPIAALRAAFAAVFAGLRGLSSANPRQAARGPLKAETRVRIPLEPPPFRRGFPQHQPLRSHACCHSLLPFPKSHPCPPMCLEPSTRGARLNGRGNGPGRAGRQLDRQASLDHAAISLEGGPGHVQGSVHFLPATLVVLLVDGVRVELQEVPVVRR